MDTRTAPPSKPFSATHDSDSGSIIVPAAPSLVAIDLHEQILEELLAHASFNMSRGGRGRGGSAARVNGQPLPFEVDAALESEVAASRARDREDDGDDWKRTLYPVSHAVHPLGRTSSNFQRNHEAISR